MSNFFSKIMRGVQVGAAAVRNADNIAAVERNLDAIIEQKAVVKHQSKLDIHRTTTDIMYAGIHGLFRQYTKMAGGDVVPQYGTYDFDDYTSKVWMNEPILAGAVYSMGAKMTALKWQITGPKQETIDYAKIMSRAAFVGGYDWGGFASSSATDFYTINRGVFWETARNGNRYTGTLADIGYIDALACFLTGNTKTPVHYISNVTGQNIKFKPGEFIQFASMPSGREEYLGIGFCAVARALRAAKLLMGLHNYDAEKLVNLPPEGVAAVTGLTIDEFQDALALWMAARKKDNSLTFPQVLWLIGSNPNANVEVSFTGFSQIPESFDRKTVVEQYVNTLALDFGVDAREFWPISTSSMGTAAESEIQHMKAKGKGPGEFISIMERHINGELPEGIDFGFDTQDIEEDAIAAANAKAWVDALLPLATPTAEGAKSVITTEDLLRLLADRDVLPDYMVQDKRVVVHDSDIHEKGGDYWGYGDEHIVIKWNKGKLTATTMPAVTIITNDLIEVPFANVSKGEFFLDGPERDTLTWKAQSDAPNYRQATDISKKCTTCEYANGQYCELYDFTFKKGWVCDSWESAEEKELLIYLKQREDAILEANRNIRGKPIPSGEAVRGDRVNEQTIKDELARWRNHPILSRYVPEEESTILGRLNGSSKAPTTVTTERNGSTGSQ